MAAKAREKAAKASLWIGGDYVCTKCDPHRKFAIRDRDMHEEYHRMNQQIGAPGAEKLENVIAKAEREAKAEEKKRERRRSSTVEQEVAKRNGNNVVPMPQRPSADPTPATPAPTVEARTRAAWDSQIEKRRKIMSGETNPSTNGQARAVSGPARGLIEAAKGLTDAMPADHEEMRELMFAFDAASRIFAEAVEAFQSNQINRGFHPTTMAPLDLVGQGMNESRVGYTYTLIAIERFYRPNFEAAQNPGPGETFFGAQPAGRGRAS